MTGRRPQGIGGKTRAKNLSGERRREIARKAAQARWKKKSWRSILLQQTGAPISISAQRATLEMSAFVIVPAAFVDDIEYHFERYVAALRDPKNADLRDNSTRTWERKHAGRPLHVPLGFPPGFGPSSSLGLG